MSAPRRDQIEACCPVITCTHLALFLFSVLFSCPLSRFGIYRNLGLFIVGKPYEAQNQSTAYFILRFFIPVYFKRNLTLIHLSMMKMISSQQLFWFGKILKLFDFIFLVFSRIHLLLFVSSCLPLT